MNAALETRNTNEDFDFVLEKDILYFRTGHHGLVSFHGKNFNVKRRLSTEQLHQIIADGIFLQVNTDCFANLNKINSIKDKRIYFEINNPDSKTIPISRLRLYRLKNLQLKIIE
jgi:DNA-binding LytR/AlgR family response regulator